MTVAELKSDFVTSFIYLFVKIKSVQVKYCDSAHTVLLVSEWGKTETVSEIEQFREDWYELSLSQLPFFTAFHMLSVLFSLWSTASQQGSST